MPLYIGRERQRKMENSIAASILNKHNLERSRKTLSGIKNSQNIRIITFQPQTANSEPKKLFF